MATGEYGKSGWKFEVEAMVKNAKPVFEKARSVILESRYEIVGMRGMKGTVVNTTATTLGIPTGKIAGLIHDVSSNIDKMGS
jgi:hypothetical protein